MRKLLLTGPTGGSTVHTARCVRYRKTCVINMTIFMIVVLEVSRQWVGRPFS